MQRQLSGPGSRILAVLALCGLVACADDVVAPADTFDPGDGAAFSFSPPPPLGLMTVASGGTTLELWPFTGRDLAGSQTDPMNLIFTGEIDLVSLRAALMSLDGDRSAFMIPNVFPFNCTWSDAFGDIQTAYSDGDGWVGNPVQLACGDYNPVRFHLRLFHAGPWVIGGAHFEVLVDQTTEHEVFSWELAEQLVLVDMLRIGASVVGVAPIYPAPSYRAINKDVYNGVLRAFPALLGALGYPLSPQGADFPIPTDGAATIIHVSARPTVVPGTWTNEFTLPFNQFVPRPFCSACPFDIVKVEGDISFQQSTAVGTNGKLNSHQVASGEVWVTPFDVFTGTFGEPFRALLRNTHITSVVPNGSSTQAIVQRLALPPAENGSFRTHLNTSPNGGAHFTVREVCN
jgi:hypothetical protein